MLLHESFANPDSVNGWRGEKEKEWSGGHRNDIYMSEGRKVRGGEEEEENGG